MSTKKGPRRTDTRVAGAIRLAREHPEQCDEFLRALDRMKTHDPTVEAEKTIRTTGYRHRAEMAMLYRERDFAREILGLPGDLIPVVRGAVEAAKALARRPNACASPAPDAPADQPPPEDAPDAPTVARGGDEPYVEVAE